MVEQRILPQGGIDADQERPKDDECLRRQHQDECIRDAFADNLQDGRAAVDQGGAEVAAQDPAPGPGSFGDTVPVHVNLRPVVANQPVDVLHHDGFVQSQLAFKALVIGRTRDAPPPHRCDRVAHVHHQDEQDETDDEQQRNALQDTAEDVTGQKDILCVVARSDRRERRSNLQLGKEIASSGKACPERSEWERPPRNDTSSDLYGVVMSQSTILNSGVTPENLTPVRREPTAHTSGSCQRPSQ